WCACLPVHCLSLRLEYAAPRSAAVVEGARDLQAVPSAAGTRVLQSGSGHSAASGGKNIESRRPIAACDKRNATSADAPTGASARNVRQPEVHELATMTKIQTAWRK